MNIVLFLKKVLNTFLTPRYKFWYFDYDRKFVKIKKNQILFNLLSRIWFLPIDIQARYWHNITIKDNHNYHKYKKIDKRAKILLKAVIDCSNKKNDKILDLGSNVGRHLNYLTKKKFINLNGVDICKLSIDKSKKIFPKLKKINLRCSSFENYLVNSKNGEFDIIYTHGATIEMVKPTFPLVSELFRVSKKYIILLINENGHKFPVFGD